MLGAAKRWVKRTPWALTQYRKIAWPLHVKRDEFVVRHWRRTSEVEVPHGFRLVSGAHPAYEQMRLGIFEQAETVVIKAELQGAEVFVDVGANLGYYAMMAAIRGKRVVAFEPQPINLRCLYRNIVANGVGGLVEVHPVALAEHIGLLPLFGASGPSASLVKGWAGYSPKHSQTVPVNTLDNLLHGRFQGQKLLVKIDVEGAEYGVVQGAALTLARTPRPTWLVEICFHEYHPGGNPKFAEIFDLFWDAGYVAALASGREVSRADLARWIEAGRTDGEGFNYVFR